MWGIQIMDIQNEWLYKGQYITSRDEMPQGTIGFIYLLTHISSGRKYIGRKLVDKAHRRQKNKKIIRTRIESDWREYWSSSPDVKELVESEGHANFTREIIGFASGRAILNYAEECLQYSLGVLESDEWLNSNIRSKAYKKHIKGKHEIEEIRDAIMRLSKSNACTCPHGTGP